MSIRKKLGLLGATFFTAAAGMAVPAMAQDAPQPAQAGSQAEPQEEEVVVTGSRIRRDEFTSTAPIQVITGETATLEGLIDAGEVLQSSSVAAGSFQLNGQFGGFVVEGGTGINSVSLRGLGAQRSLVLLNGRRPGPAGVRGQVGAFDLNVIPSSVIQRYEILKDGASSVYGSDAVAGVVNVITVDRIDDPIINFEINQPFEDGGESYSIDGAYGLKGPLTKLGMGIAFRHPEADFSPMGSRDFFLGDVIFDFGKGGTLRVVKNGVLLPTPFLSITVDQAGERGLLGVALDPQFAANRFVYVYYTVPTEDRKSVV